MRRAIFAFSIFLSLFLCSIASAETTVSGVLEAEGTHFALTDSDYLNISLESTELIHVRLESVPQIVTMEIRESTSTATTTTITMSGFSPNTTHYKYEDNYHNLIIFTTDESGTYSYVQNIETPHLVFIQTHKSTKFLRDDATGGDCSSVGIWNTISKICTLTQNLFETIQIDSSNIILDGNNFTLSGFHTGAGVFMNGKSGVTITNLNITNFSFGTRLFNSDNNRLINNHFTNIDGQGMTFSNSHSNIVTGNAVSLLIPSTSRRQGFTLSGSRDNLFQDNRVALNTRASSPGHQGILLFSASNNNTFTSNTVFDAYQGVLLFDSHNNNFTGNSASNTNQGILLFNSSNNVFHENIIRETQNTGFTIFAPSNGNSIYNNNFVHNATHAVNFGGTGNVFTLSAPDGGNFWDTFDELSEGCGDANEDQFCDTPRVFTGGQDNLPWMTQDGWKTLVTQAPVLSFAIDTPLGLSEDDGIQDHKGTAGKTLFTFTTIFTDASNNPLDNLEVDIIDPLTGSTTILAMHPNLSDASSTLRDGDYQNGEAYSATSTFQKGTFTYFFSATAGPSVLRLPLSDTLSFKTGYSNVAFFPGLEASRLYESVGLNGENQLWEPNRNVDVEKLYLSSTTGRSINNIYSRDIIDEANIIPDPTGALDSNVYKNFMTFMDEKVVGEGLIHEWESIPYDWRLDYETLFNDGQKIGNNIYYGFSDREHYILNELDRLARTSDTGKVTIITHSNGGLLAKYILATMGASNDAQLKTFDKVIMVAAPQIGTPGAVEGLLHGDKQQLGIEFADWGFLMDEERSRELGENMQSAYNLIPSAAYFDAVSDPMLTFDPSVDRAYSFSAFYGHTITTPLALNLFLTGEAGGRSEPDADDEESPNVLKNNFLQKSTETHVLIDAWIPPLGLEVIQIAGWGVDTLKNIHYSCGFVTCSSLSTLDRKINQTLDGDGTVVVPSASWMATSSPNVERWWVDIYKQNGIGLATGRINRDHASILEIKELQSFIGSIIIGERTAGSSDVVVGTKPNAEDVSDRLRFTMHSPVDIHLYDSVGNHTGIIPNPDPASDIRFYEKTVPNSYYKEFGETKYAGADTATTTIVHLQGLALGTYTFDIEQVSGDDSIVASTTFIDIPVTASTTGIMIIPEGGFSGTPTSTPTLVLDIDGDGITDLSLNGDISGVTEEELVVILKGVIKTLHLPVNKEKQLLQKIDKLAKELAKEHGHQKVEKRKTKHVFIELLKTIDRYEKKHILTTDESSELRSIIEQIRGSVIK